MGSVLDRRDGRRGRRSGLSIAAEAQPARLHQYFIVTYLELRHSVMYVRREKNKGIPGVKLAVCDSALIGLQAVRPPSSSPPLGSSARLGSAQRDARRHGHTHPGSPPVGQRRGGLSAAGCCVTLSGRCESTLTPRSSSDQSPPRRCHPSVHCKADKLAEERNSNDLIIFLSEPAHRRVRCRRSVDAKR